MGVREIRSWDRQRNSRKRSKKTHPCLERKNCRIRWESQERETVILKVVICVGKKSTRSYLEGDTEA